MTFPKPNRYGLAVVATWVGVYFGGQMGMPMTMIGVAIGLAVAAFAVLVERQA